MFLLRSFPKLWHWTWKTGEKPWGENEGSYSVRLCEDSSCIRGVAGAGLPSRVEVKEARLESVLRDRLITQRNDWQNEGRRRIDRVRERTGNRKPGGGTRWREQGILMKENGQTKIDRLKKNRQNKRKIDSTREYQQNNMIERTYKDGQKETNNMAIRGEYQQEKK